MELEIGETVEGATESIQARSQAAVTAAAEPKAGSLLPRLVPPRNLQCHLAAREDLEKYPVWQSTFAACRKDYRYYEILEDTVRDRFDYRYFVITDEDGDALAVQPFFVMDQDMLEGVAALARPLAAIRKVLPRFLMMRTLMVGCSA